ncbi:hypothetical protein LT335_00219 [Spiroplasma sp. JKS002669]|uniref:hypothetical protein n=1 Tax=Spiroplasma attinicola TaxID=2904537 RepID=UPI002022E0FC|nr:MULTISPECIES: hypothetical protein [unclassified Spiroplasma]MCL6428672.1 hypothetical protein [Spiroplasma sp. JKS002669]MCL8210975.1 hypothetical protein [Spiroplasma sp. JKS002671]
MKKILVTLGFVGALTTSTAAGVLNINNQTNIVTTLTDQNLDNSINTSEAIYGWTDININDKVQTKATGTHKLENTSFAYKATTKSWNDYFINSKFLLISGAFTLHTNKNPKEFNNIVVNISETRSNDLERVWSYSETNDQWRGWGHQTSTITLTVTAKYDEKEATTLLSVSSYIYARTAGSVHACWTTSEVDTIRFIVD